MMYNIMSTQEQLKQAMTEVADKQKTYDENSVDEARAKWDEASALVQYIQAGGRSIHTLHEARQSENDARMLLDDAIKNAGHLQLAKREREQEQAKNAALEAERHAAQVEHAAAEKANFRAEAKTRWLAAGGSEHSFGEQFESLWTDEVRRRVQLVPNEQEAMRQKLAQSGRYSA